MATGDKKQRTTKPGSRSDFILRLVGVVAAQKGRGLDTQEIRAAYEAKTKGPAPSSLTSEVYSLKKRGLLEVTGGRAGRSLYAPYGSGLQGLDNPDDDALLVLRALRTGYRRFKRPLSTREVAAELDRLGLQLESTSQNAVKKYLETLASRRRKRGAKGFRAPQARRMRSEAVTGAPSAFWVPFGAEPDSPPPPRSAADAVRAAVGAACEGLGRPVAISELRWWHDTAAAQEVHGGILTRDHLGHVLVDTARADSEHEGRTGRIHTCETWWTCHGGPPIRYSLGPPSESGLMACEFMDHIRVLRPAYELQSIDGLRVRAEGIGSWPLTAVAGIRQRLLTDLFADWAEHVNKAAAFTAMLRGQAVLRRWYDEVRDTLSRDMQYGREQAINGSADQLLAGIELFGKTVPTRPRPLSIGAVARTTFAELTPLLNLAGHWLGIEDEQAQFRLVTKARRVPARGARARRLPGVSTEPITYVDRVDALLAIWEAFPAPRAAALLRDASETLGYVLRDAGVLRSVFDENGPRDDYGRRTIVVCLGLLGEHVEPEFAIRSWSEYDDTVAWVLSTVLADWQSASARISACESMLNGAGQRVTDTALMRLDASAPFSVVG